MMNDFFFELSGEHPTMPAAEALACVRIFDAGAECRSGPGYAAMRFDDRFVGDVIDRVALTQKVGQHLGSFDVSDDMFDDITIPEGTFAVRARRYKGMMRNADTQDLTRKLGNVLSKKNDVSLRSPDIEVRMFVSDKVHVFICDADIDRNSFEERKVSERPFFSPISLHPRFARAAINLTGVKKGGIVMDPFCGTGGIAIEAASMGMKVIASDFDENMVSGCVENMDHYGLKLYDSDVLDIGDIPKRFADVDAVVTDPPYGRSTHTGGEDTMSIHNRAICSIEKCLRLGGRAAVVLPYELRTDVMKKEDVFVQRVHRSLSRHYHILSKR